ncbi:MAG: hypothetical protein ACRCSG_08280 [Cellulosilyticaceae bacterium]
MKKNQKGTVLVVVIVVFSVVLLLGTALLQLTNVSHKQSLHTVEKKQATYMAESGLEIVLKYVKDKSSEASNILPTNIGDKVKSSPFVLEDASNGKWNVSLEIENTPGDPDVYKITSTATGTNTKSDITDNVSVIVKGEKDTLPLPLGGTDTINFISDGSIVGIRNGGMLSKESIEFKTINDEQSIEMEYMITLGDIITTGSSVRMDIGQMYAGGSIDLTGSNQIKVGRMEAVGNIILNEIANSYQSGTSIPIDDSYLDIDKVYTNGSIQLIKMQPEKKPIKMGEVVAVENLEISENQRNAQIGDIRVGGNFTYKDVPVQYSSESTTIQNIIANGNINIEAVYSEILGNTIVSDEDVSLKAILQANGIGGIFFNKLQMTSGTFTSLGVDINKEIIASENAPTIPTREDSWVGQGDGAITTSILLDSTGNPYQVPLWIEEIIEKSEQQKITIYNKMCQLVDMDPTSVVTPMNEIIDMQNRIDEWNMTEGRIFIDDRDTAPEPKPDPTQTIIINGDNVDGEYPMNIYHPKGKIIFRNFGTNGSVTFKGSIIAKEIEIINSHDINFDLGGSAGGSSSTGGYNSFEIIKYEK